MDTPALSRARWRRALALLGLCAIGVVACGGDDNGGGAGPNTTAQSGAATNTTLPAEDEPDPVPGGTLRYGLEADTSTPWTPQSSVCAISCHMIMRTVYDTLALYDEEGNPKPYLADAITPNDDFTEWTITPRAGVKFHDGTDFDAAAICDNLTRHLSSILTGKALLNIADGDDGPGPHLNDDSTACIVPMVDPWANFPVYLSGQIGYMASPTWLAAVDGDPSLASQPVGTGPFVFESYEPGGTFVATKNPNYWRGSGEGSTGEGLPYLDRVEMRVFVDVQSRVNALLDGQVDMIHVSNGEFIASLRNESSIEMEETDTYGETNYLLINNRDPVMSDIRVRRALALATDNESLSRDRSAGVNPPANGPFSPTQMGYLDDTGYPAFDLAAATELVNEYEAENGPLTVTFDTTNDPYNEETNQLIAANWEAAGIDVNINTVEQGAYIVNALQGKFQVFGWRNHGGVNPDSQRIWWHSETGILSDQQPLALNFGGINDEVIDSELDAIRATNDPDELREHAENINRRFGEQVYNIWNTWTVWGLAHSPAVHNIQAFTFPDGSPTIPGAGIAGTHQIVQMWIEH